MSSKGISAHKIRNIMQKAALYPMDVNEIFDENIRVLIDNICSSSQMPREYLITMLLPAIGHFVNGSQVRTNTGTPTNISFFTTIIGYPSVNKSSATEAILNACLIIEKHIGIKSEDSRINCSATVESLLTELKNTSPRLIQIWDEAVTLLQSFGLYKQGGAAYDRSIMCTLYNSSAVVKRQTKSGNIAVENPVLNIAAAAHPADIFSSVSNESDDDGLMARFLFSAPEPCIPLSNEIKSLNIDEPSLTHLLYLIYCFNSTEQSDVRRTTNDDDQRIMYSYSEDAQKVINNVFDEYTLQIREAYGIDQGLGSILGKAKVQVSRLAGAVHATSLASAVFDQLISDDSLPSYYDKSKPIFDLLKRAVRDFKETHKWTVISEDTAKAAVILMNYFVTQKKIYTNRPVNETLDEMRKRFEQKQDDQKRTEKNQEILAESRRSKLLMRSDDGGEQRYPEKIILLAKGTKIPWINISLNHGGFKEATLHAAAANLQNENLGQLTKEKHNGAQRATTYFLKIMMDPQWDAATLISFSNKLAKYNVSVKAYQASFKLEPGVSTTETETDDNSMDFSSPCENIEIPPPPPALPPRATVQAIASSSTNYGFLTPPPARRANPLRRTQTQVGDILSTTNTATPQSTMYPSGSQSKKKNRIEPIEKPTSCFAFPPKDILQSPRRDVLQSPRRDILQSPRRDILQSPRRLILQSPRREILQSQEYSYQNF